MNNKNMMVRIAKNFQRKDGAGYLGSACPMNAPNVKIMRMIKRPTSNVIILPIDISGARGYINLSDKSMLFDHHRQLCK